MSSRPPSSTRTDTLFPFTTLFRSPRAALADHAVVFGFDRDEGPAPDQVVIDRADEDLVVVVESADHGIARRAGGEPAGEQDRGDSQDSLGIHRWFPSPFRAGSRQTIRVRNAPPSSIPANSEERRVGNGRVSTCRSRLSRYP